MSTKLKQSIDDVMSKLGAAAPHLAEHCYLDRDWVWYCGPSLQKKPEDRTILKKLGFRWSKGGHQMPDGRTMGTWGHSCQRPMFPKRKPGPVVGQPMSHPREPFDAELREMGL